MTTLRAVLWKCAATLLLAASMSAQAAEWRGITDSEGFTWARVLIVNNSAQVSTWSISNCRTARVSADNSADVHPQSNWDGKVEAGLVEYVWVYARNLADVLIVNADGGDAQFMETFSPAEQGDGEIVLIIAADGSLSSAAVEPALYELPVVTGAMPE